MNEKKSKLVEIKTKPTLQSVDDFVNKIEDEQKRKDCIELIGMMKKASGEVPVLWSNAIVGFGKKIYASPSTGRQVEWMLIGFAPRKANISLNLNTGIQKHATLLNKLGKYKTGVGCLYINKLDDIDKNILNHLIENSLNRD